MTRWRKRCVGGLVVMALLGVGRWSWAADAASASGASTAPAAASGGVAILQDVKRFGNLGSVLYVAAHPDDENTLLITYLARGRGCRTAYLSLTRGDGGQNVIGPEFGGALGVIRTQELLAARRLDGGRQFFSRAIDFGFSKDYRETLKVWGREEVLGDVVRIYREFRPDVVITRFSPEPSNTHGHHTASAVLALEAFKISGDPKAYPEQLKQGLTVWQPKRILQNGRGGGEGDLRIDVSGTDPVLHETYAEIAGRSRAMHKSQGFGGFGYGGGGRGPRMESFHLLDGAAASKDIFDGVDTTWNRVEGGAGIAAGAEELVAKFDPADPAGSVQRVLALRKELAGLSVKDPVVEEKKGDLDRVLAECLGLSVRTTVDHAEVLPGEDVTVHQRVTIASSAVPVRWMTVQSRPVVDLRPGEAAEFDGKYQIPAGAAVSQPYWLEDESAVGVAKVGDARLIGRPENPPVLKVDYNFEVGGQSLTVWDEPVQLPPAGSAQPARRMAVIPPVSLAPVGPVELFAPGASHAVEVEIESARADASGVVRLKAPAGWTVSPGEQGFDAMGAGERRRVTFNVTAPKEVGTGLLAAEAEVGGVRCGTRRIEINYPHIPPQVLQPAATVKAVCLEMGTRGHSVAYLAGAGDSVAECLGQMGYAVTPISGEDLTAEKLAKFDAVVVGVRALNVRTDLRGRMEGLFEYVKDGGNVVMQYNRPERGLKVERIGPYELELSTQRVTDEDAAVTFLAPEHPVLNTPNKISAADFRGWVQEMGIYYPTSWDSHYVPILAASDVGEAPLKGGLLVARYGKGYFTYTGLVFFRELPAGVPGAYRLFANLVSLGK